MFTKEEQNFVSCKFSPTACDERIHSSIHNNYEWFMNIFTPNRFFSIHKLYCCNCPVSCGNQFLYVGVNYV